jgi:DNA-binding NarL/FixJ family response regulator
MITNLIDIGVDGYLLKNCSKEELINAIKQVSEGGQYFSSGVTHSLLSPDEKSNKEIVENLTKREIEILQHIANGLTNKEIGEELFISYRTVDTHRTNLMKKLNLRNIAGLISFAIKNRIVD